MTTSDTFDPKTAKAFEVYGNELVIGQKMLPRGGLGGFSWSGRKDLNLFSRENIYP